MALTTPTWIDAPATPATMLRRGLRQRCARCGAGDLYPRRRQMVERCPRCGVKFERKEGSLAVAWLIAVLVAEGLLLIALMAVVNEFGGDASRPHVLAEVLVGTATIVLAVVGPLACYPTARTIGFAIDLSSTPLADWEQTAADTAILRAIEAQALAEEPRA